MAADPEPIEPKGHAPEDPMTTVRDGASGREELRGRGRFLEWFTLGSCAAEAVVGLLAGSAAASMALIGFGLQSLVEVISGGIMLWRLKERRSTGQARLSEGRALRIIGVTLMAVAAYIAWGAGKDLWRGERPAASLAGMLLAVASLLIMPALARAKRRVASGLHSAALRADAVHTDVCTWQAAIMLAGLALNALLGWWWADPAAALCMVPLIAREGLRAMRGEPCGCIDCHEE